MDTPPESFIGHTNELGLVMLKRTLSDHYVAFIHEAVDTRI